MSSLGKSCPRAFFPLAGNERESRDNAHALDLNDDVWVLDKVFGAVGWVLAGDEDSLKRFTMWVWKW